MRAHAVMLIGRLASVVPNSQLLPLAVWPSHRVPLDLTTFVLPTSMLLDLTLAFVRQPQLSRHEKDAGVLEQATQDGAYIDDQLSNVKKATQSELP